MVLECPKGGILITAEGIDSSGKGVIIDTWRKLLKDAAIPVDNETFEEGKGPYHGVMVSDIRAPIDKNKSYETSENSIERVVEMASRLTTYEEWNQEPPFYIRYLKEHPTLNATDVFVVCEPTWWGVGRTIREEFTRKGTNYPVKLVAEAYAMDRAALYNRIILPVLEDSKMILQDRSVASSIAYQPLQAEFQNEKLSLDDVLNLYGNKIALSRSPNLLAITEVPVDVAMERLRLREKQDDSIFEAPEFQSALLERYTSSWLRELYEAKGTKVVYIDTSKGLDHTEEQSYHVLAEFLNKQGIDIRL